MLKQKKEPDNPFATSFDAGDLFTLMNPKLLPDFAAVKKYFGVSTNYGVSREDGFYFEFYTGK